MMTPFMVLGRDWEAIMRNGAELKWEEMEAARRLEFKICRPDAVVNRDENDM